MILLYRMEYNRFFIKNLKYLITMRLQIHKRLQLQIILKRYFTKKINILINFAIRDLPLNLDINLYVVCMS